MKLDPVSSTYPLFIARSIRIVCCPDVWLGIKAYWSNGFRDLGFWLMWSTSLTADGYPADPDLSLLNGLGFRTEDRGYGYALIFAAHIDDLV